MPEGDTIYRASRALHRALAGKTVTRFETTFPSLARIDFDAPLRGRQIESVGARGKWSLMRFSGGLVLATHMRMHGSWHLYRPGERWRRPQRDLRLLVEVEDFIAAAFNVPVAEFHSERSLARHPGIVKLGPDLLGRGFDAVEAIRRLRESQAQDIAAALLDQSVMAGVGNVFKSEVLFACGISPFATPASLTEDQLERIVQTAEKLLAANALDSKTTRPAFYSPWRRTTGMLDPGARLWVYGRAGKPCRKCGTPVEFRRQEPGARSTYWCPECQRQRRATSSEREVRTEIGSEQTK